MSFFDRNGEQNFSLWLALNHKHNGPFLRHKARYESIYKKKKKKALEHNDSISLLIHDRTNFTHDIF